MSIINNINWFPGHMKKAFDQIKQVLPSIDLVVEIGDGRAPKSSLNPYLDKLVENKNKLVVFSKKDLSDLAKLEKFILEYKKRNIPAIYMDFKSKQDIKNLVQVMEATKTKKENKYLKYGLVPPAKRCLIIGIPNVGKSTLINSIANRKATSVANKPGHTKSQQLIKVSSKLELVDTPGILPPNYDDKLASLHLAWIGSIKDEAIDIEQIYTSLDQFVIENYPNYVYQRYNIDRSIQLTKENFYLEIAKARNFILKDNQLDINRAKVTFLNEFRLGVLGKVVVDD